jgi:hypothetical protein
VTQELFESGIRARACSPEALRLTFWYVTSRPAKCGGFRVVLLPPRLARARLHALLRGAAFEEVREGSITIAWTGPAASGHRSPLTEPELGPP